MPGEHIIVLAIDGLRASALGAYGNTSFLTPALDQLAAESLVLDACFADTTDLAQIYRSLWQSMHPLQPEAIGGTAETLPRQLSERGYAATLITDDPAVVALPMADLFDECVQIPIVPADKADDIADTSLARLFAAACEQIQNTGPQFIWLHARGMYGPWDAPLVLQEPLLEQDEGDPDPCDAVEPPSIADDRGVDPDEAYRWNCGYAAQVMVLDECLDGLQSYLREIGVWDQCRLVLCGVRGFPLGEHGRIGGVDERLYVEQLHVPMLVRRPNGAGRLERTSRLVSQTELLPMLLDRVVPPREALIASSPGGLRAIRTADWCLRCEPQADDDTADGPTCELYVRPDDRWEANDVAGLCPDVVEELSRQLAQKVGELEQSEAPQSAERC